MANDGTDGDLCLVRAVPAPKAALILDQPFRGLDERTRDQVAAWLSRELRGRTVILLDHIRLTGIATDRCFRLCEGRLASKGN